MYTHIQALHEKFSFIELLTQEPILTGNDIDFVIIPIIDEILNDVNLYEEMSFLEGLNSILNFIWTASNNQLIQSSKLIDWIDTIKNFNNVLGNKAIGEYQLLIEAGLDDEDNYINSFLLSSYVDLAETNSSLIQSLNSLVLIEELFE